MAWLIDSAILPGIPILVIVDAVRNMSELWLLQATLGPIFYALILGALEAVLLVPTRRTIGMLATNLYLVDGHIRHLSSRKPMVPRCSQRLVRCATRAGMGCMPWVVLWDLRYALTGEGFGIADKVADTAVVPSWRWRRVLRTVGFHV